MSRLTSGFRTSLIQLVIFLGLLLLLERALQLWLPFEESQLKEHTFSQNIEGLKPQITYRIGRYGARSLQRIAQEKAEGQIRILCLGASTTEQVTQETKDTWCGILEIELKKKFPKYADRLQTIAFGTGGHRAADSAFWLREHIELIKPDVVITLLGINDLIWNGGKNYHYQNIETEFAKRAKSKQSNIQRICKEYSQICRRLINLKQFIDMQLALRNNKIIEWHSSNLPRLREQLRNYPESETINRTPDPFHEFQDVSNWLADYLSHRNVKLIMLGQPVAWQAQMPQNITDQLWFPVSTSDGPVRATGAWLQRAITQYNTAQKQIALRNGAYYQDLDALIPKTRDFYFDDCHFTDQGSRKVAMSVMPVLTEVLEIF